MEFTVEIYRRVGAYYPKCNGKYICWGDDWDGDEDSKMDMELSEHRKHGIKCSNLDKAKDIIHIYKQVALGEEVMEVKVN